MACVRPNLMCGKFNWIMPAALAAGPLAAGAPSAPPLHDMEQLTTPARAEPFSKDLRVAKVRVQPLRIGVQIPRDAKRLSQAVVC